jgi:hypothetical protein
MARPEVTVQIRAWLEKREIHGLRRAFRGQLSCPPSGPTRGVTSVHELHRQLDEVLRDGGLLDDEDAR